MVTVVCGHPGFENTKWKIPEMNSSEILIFLPLLSSMDEISCHPVLLPRE
jgi:hypothetical protein